MGMTQTRLIFLIFTIFSPSLGFACNQSGMQYKASTINKTYKYLSNTWVYYTADHSSIQIQTISKKTCGKVGKIIANNIVLELPTLYNDKGIKIIDSDYQIPPPATAKQSHSNQENIPSRMTAIHNSLRHQTNPKLKDLVWSDTLTAYAQKWANKLQKDDCNMKHRRGKDRIRAYGENLAWAQGEKLSPEQVVHLWYEEIQYYDYATNTCNGVCGHYTQVVWHSSKKLGCALASCTNSEVWVCNYDPPGNWVGEKPY